MGDDHPQSAASGACRRAHLRSFLPSLGAALALLLAGSAVAAPTASAPARDAERLSSSLAGIAALADERVQPPARRLAQGLPGSVEQLRALREPAATTQDQAQVAFDELRQMGIPGVLDPHYLPALVAAGRAFFAASGQDPLTRTTVNPDYLGLERELAAAEAGLAGSARAAAKLSARVGRLTRALARMRRRAGRLTRLLRHDPAARRR